MNDQNNQPAKTRKLFKIDEFENNQESSEQAKSHLHSEEVKDDEKEAASQQHRETKTDVEIKIVTLADTENSDIKVSEMQPQAEQAKTHMMKEELAEQKAAEQNKQKVQNVPPHTYPPNYARMRKPTEFDLYENACKLKIEITKYIMNENKVPKRYRWIEGEPLVKYASYIRDCIGIANDIKLDGSQENLNRRTKISTYALAFCNVFQTQLIELMKICQGATPESLKAVTELLLKITRAIPHWQASDKKRSEEKAAASAG